MDKALSKFRDELITCSCGNEYIYGFNEKKHNDSCPDCKKKNQFCYLVLNKNKILLEPGKAIYENHLNKYSSNYNKEVAKVIVNKNNPSLWGIKLNLDKNILIKDSHNNEKEINNLGIIPIIKDLKIKFDDGLIGEIYSNN